MLTKYFKRQRFLNRLLYAPVGPFAEGFVEYLGNNGFSGCTICNHLGVIGHFGHWTTKHHVDVVNMDEGTCNFINSDRMA
jgi:hypothetical protein